MLRHDRRMGSGVGKFKAPFYPFKARVDSVEPAGVTGIVACFDGNQIADGKLKRRHSAFQVRHVVANRRALRLESLQGFIDQSDRVESRVNRIPLRPAPR
jgi:hypothetical protein